MLALIEEHIGDIRGVSDLASAEATLARIATAFGFRNAQLLEFTPDLRGVTDLSLDTLPGRKQAGLNTVRDKGLRAAVDAIRKMLETDTVVRRSIDRVSVDHPYREFWERYDLIDAVAVPISLDREVAGLVTFSGTPELKATEMLALQTLSYALFAQIRSLRNASSPDLPEVMRPMTPRERQVMQLSAAGLTSNEIGLELGMAARTANQHVDNVIEKLGSRNRTHVIAELIRHRLLT